MPVINPSGGGGGGVGAVLFDSTLGVDTASIDTGAAGIAQTQNVLQIFIYGRTDQAAALSSITLTLNNDSSAIYSRAFTQMTNATVIGATELVNTGVTLNAPGANAGPNVFGAIHIVLPHYTNALNFKSFTYSEGVPDTLGTSERSVTGVGAYRSTSAITRAKIAPSAGGNLKSGTRFLILGA